MQKKVLYDTIVFLKSEFRKPFVCKMTRLELAVGDVKTNIVIFKNKYPTINIQEDENN